MSFVLLFILIGVIVLVLSIMQVTTPSSTTIVTMDNNGVPSTKVITTVAADVHFLEDAITSVMSIIGTVGMILAVILVANGTGSEYSWNTMRPYLLCSESRLKMITAKLTAGTFIIIGMIIGVLIAVLLGVLFTAIRGFSWDMSFVTMSFVWHQLLTFVRTLYVIMPYTLMAFLFTVLGRSTAAPDDPSDGLVEIAAEDKYNFKDRLAEIRAWHMLLSSCVGVPGHQHVFAVL
jgi:hypothetical protein